MSIYYALVARGSTILVDFTEHNGNFQQITTNILQSVDVSHDSMCSYTSDKYAFHVVISRGLIFLCMSDESMRKSIAYGYINEIKNRFMSGALKERAYTCNAYELRQDFESVLRQQMTRYNKGGPEVEGNSKIKSLQDDVDGLRSVMTENIGKLLERGERLDILVDKTENLTKSSESFARTAKKVKNKMWWQNKKMCLILSCIIFVILAIITFVVLFEAGVFKASASSSPTHSTQSPKLSTPSSTTTTLKSTNATIEPRNATTTALP